MKHEISPTDIWLANPALPEQLTGESMPNEISVAENFLHHLNCLVSYLDDILKLVDHNNHSLLGFLHIFYSYNPQLKTNYFKLFDERLNSLLRTLRIDNTDSFLSIQKVCHFATLWGTYLDFSNEFKIETGPSSSILDVYPSYGNVVKVNSNFFFKM